MGGEQGLVGVVQDDIGNGNGYEFFCELRVKMVMVVNGGDNCWFQVGEIVGGCDGGWCWFGGGRWFRKQVVDGEGYFLDGENEQQQEYQYKVYVEIYQGEVFV